MNTLEALSKTCADLLSRHPDAVMLGEDVRDGGMLGLSRIAAEDAELRRRVTSPGGVTEKAIDKLLDGNIDKLFTDALETAKERSIELANVLGKS